MKKFEALVINWVQEMNPTPLMYKKKILYTEAENEQEAKAIFKNFAREHKIAEFDIAAIPISANKITKKYCRV